MAIDWKGVRADYERRGISFEELSKTYCLSPETIRKKAGKEGWKVCPRGKKRKKKAGPGNLISEHRRLWGDVKKKLSDGLKRGDEKELKLARLAGDALLDIVKGEKEAWGINEDDVDGYGDEIHETVRQMERLTVPSPAGKALDGE